MSAFGKEAAYSTQLGNMPLSKEDMQNAMQIFKHYLEEESLCRTFHEAIPIFFVDYSNSGGWNPNPIEDKRTCYYFYITRKSDGAVSVPYLFSSVYSEDKRDCCKGLSICMGGWTATLHVGCLLYALRRCVLYVLVFYKQRICLFITIITDMQMYIFGTVAAHGYICWQKIQKR